MFANVNPSAAAELATLVIAKAKALGAKVVPAPEPLDFNALKLKLVVNIRPAIQLPE